MMCCIWILLEILITLLTMWNLRVWFLFAVIGALFWAFIASYICVSIPFLKTKTINFYLVDEVPDSNYGILCSDADGFICYDMSQTDDVHNWLIDNAIYGKRVKNVWERI